MKKKIILPSPKFILCVLIIGPLCPFANLLYGQVTIGAREIALGQATAALNGSTWALFSNPSLVSAEGHAVSFYGLRYYGLPNITDMAALLTYVTPVGVFGAGIHRFGDDLYSENRLRVGYKNEFKGFHYGVTAGYMHVIQGGDYGSLSAFGVDAGLAVQPARQLWIGARATNLNQPSYGSYSVGIAEELPRELALGLSYRLNDIALAAVEVVKDVRFPFSFRTGVEVQILERLLGRAGITTEPVTFAMGFGWNAPRWGINVSVQQHEDPLLGTSPGFDLRLSW